MTISCDHCGMTFKYNCFLEKHLSRKYPCFLKPQPQQVLCREIDHENKTKKQQVRGMGDKVRDKGDMVRDKGDKVRVRGDNVRDVCDMVRGEKKWGCSKCGKTLSSKKSLKRHEEKCNGCHVLQCPICLKMFSSKSTKSEHRRKVKCSPPEPEHVAPPTGDVNINSHNNITNNITNNIKIVNWSKETYDHMTPAVIANIVRKCVNAEQPLTFFSEFPTAAHQGEHKNLRVTNIRGNYLDVYEDGKFLKLMVDYVMEDCAKRMIYRLEDAMGEDERAFKGLDDVSAHLIRMEDVVHGIPKRDACEKQLRAMDALEVDLRSDVLQHVKNGLWNVAR